MIGAVVGGFTEVAKRPLLLIPALIGMALNVLILLFAIDNYFSFFFNVFLLGQVPDAGIVDLPYYLFTSYWGDIVVMSLAVFASLLVTLYLLYVYSALITKKEKGIINAMRAQLSRLGEIAGMAFFSFVGFFLYAVVSFLLFVGTVSLGVLGIIAFILLLAWFVFGIYSFLKFSFAPLFMAIEKKKMKQALKDSWKWSGKRLLEVAAVLIAVAVIAGFVNSVFGIAADATSVDEIAIVALVLGASLSNAYYNIVLVKYFQEST